MISNSDTLETREIYSAFNLHAFSVRRSVSAKSRDMAGEVIGVLRGDMDGHASELIWGGVDPAKGESATQLGSVNYCWLTAWRGIR